MPINTVSAENIRNRLELLLASNRHPYRCEVMHINRDYIAIVDGIVPEQFQAAIWDYLSILGVQCHRVDMIFTKNETTMIVLRGI